MNTKKTGKCIKNNSDNIFTININNGNAINTNNNTTNNDSSIPS